MACVSLSDCPLAGLFPTCFLAQADLWIDTLIGQDLPNYATIKNYFIVHDSDTGLRSSLTSASTDSKGNRMFTPPLRKKWKHSVAEVYRFKGPLGNENRLNFRLKFNGAWARSSWSCTCYFGLLHLIHWKQIFEIKGHTRVISRSSRFIDARGRSTNKQALILWCLIGTG